MQKGIALGGGIYMHVYICISVYTTVRIQKADLHHHRSIRICCRQYNRHTT